MAGSENLLGGRMNRQVIIWTFQEERVKDGAQLRIGWDPSSGAEFGCMGGPYHKLRFVWHSECECSGMLWSGCLVSS